MRDTGECIISMVVGDNLILHRLAEGETEEQARTALLEAARRLEGEPDAA